MLFLNRSLSCCSSASALLIYYISPTQRKWTLVSSTARDLDRTQALTSADCKTWETTRHLVPEKHDWKSSDCPLMNRISSFYTFNILGFYTFLSFWLLCLWGFCFGYFWSILFFSLVLVPCLCMAVVTVNPDPSWWLLWLARPPPAANCLCCIWLIIMTSNWLTTSSSDDVMM